MHIRVIFPFALVAAARLTAQAILGVGAVGGTVRDESGALVTGAKVTLTEESKSLVRESQSGNDGAFLFPSVVAGIYSVRVEKDGFNAERINNLRIDVGEQASIEMILHVGQMRTEMTVLPATSTDLDAGANTVGSVVDSGRVQALPLNGRAFLQLALLAGGAGDVSPASNTFTTNVGPPVRTIILPGTLPYSVGYSLNGINIRGSRDGELAMSPSIAAWISLKFRKAS